MRKIAAVERVTLNGVMQAPGRPDEDTRGGSSMADGRSYSRTR
jgi:hypothetical protein